MPIGAFKLNSLSKATLTASVEVIRRKKTILAYGNVKVSDTQSKFGGSSAYFDGDTDGLTIAPASSFGFSGDLTIECWFYTSTVAVNKKIFDFRGVSSTYGGTGNIALASTLLIDLNSTVIRVFVDGSNRVSSSPTISVNTWYHLAVVRSGNVFSFYVNGSSIGSYTQSSLVNYDTAMALGQPIGISGDGGTYQSSWFGYLDEVRFSKTARYTSNFTAPTAPFTNDDNTLLLLHMDGSYLTNNFYDDNGIRLPKPMTNNNTNAKLSTTQAKFGGTSLVCDGTSDFVTTRYDQTYSELAFGTGDFTAECWAYLSGNSIGQVLISLRNASAGQYSNMLAVGGGYLEWSDGTAWRLATTTFPINQWVHVAVTRTSGTLRLFQNGIQVYSATNTVNLTGARPYYIGSTDDGSGSTNGYIDEVRVSNISRYSSAFTPSTAPFANDSNTLLLLHFNGSNNSTIFVDDTGDVRSQTGVVPSGNAQISTTQSKFSGTSAYFDGTGDFLTFTNYGGFTTGTNDYTVEFWFRINSTTSSTIIWDQRITGSSANELCLYFNSTGSSVRVFVNGSDVITSSSISANTWYHLAYSRSGSSHKLFLNGTQTGSTWTSSASFASGNPRLGATSYDGTYAFAGYIDELRVSNNARYTSNFTPASEPFANDVNTLLLLHMDGNNTSTIFIDDNGKKTYTI